MSREEQVPAAYWDPRSEECSENCSGIAVSGHVCFPGHRLVRGKCLLRFWTPLPVWRGGSAGGGRIAVCSHGGEV